MRNETELVPLDGGQLMQLAEAYAGVEPSERRQIEKAATALEAGLPDAALEYIWNATVHNLHRKIEAYGVDIFLASFDGRTPEHKRNGESLQERWERVDAYDVLLGCERVGLISKKGMKALEFINWLRNHASAAHYAEEEEVDQIDVRIAVATIEKEVFSKPLPAPAFDFRMVIEPLKTTNLWGDPQKCEDIFGRFKQRDASTCLGMLVSLYLQDDPIPRENARHIVPIVWPLASEDARRAVGQKYFEYYFDLQSSTTPAPDDAASRLLELLKLVRGLKYIPEHLRLDLCRESARRLQQAKDTYYAWDRETSVAAEVVELVSEEGIPAEVFAEVSVGVIQVWCGNQWGRSGAHVILAPLLEGLSDDEIRQWLDLLKGDRSIQLELVYSKPNQRALELIEELGARARTADLRRYGANVVRKVAGLVRPR